MEARETVAAVHDDEDDEADEAESGPLLSLDPPLNKTHLFFMCFYFEITIIIIIFLIVIYYFIG